MAHAKAQFTFYYYYEFRALSDTKSLEYRNQ